MALAALTIPALAQKPNPAPTAAPKIPTVVSISPQGLSEPPNQVVVTFDLPVVPMRNSYQYAEMFTVDCVPAIKGYPRWNSDRQWIYSFSGNVPGGSSCTIRPSPAGLAKLGKKISAPKETKFFTDGPNIVSTKPSLSGTIEEDQIFVLKLDAPVDLQTVLTNVRFVSRQKGNRIDVRVLTGDERAQVIKDTRNRYEQAFPDQQIVVVQAKERFASGEELSFVWGKGIQVLGTGNKKVLDRVYKVAVRKALTATLNCAHENAQSDCNPLLDIDMTFSAPIPVKVAKQIQLRGDGRDRAPTLVRSDEEDPGDEAVITQLTFKGPFPAGAKFEVVLPPDLRDESGRVLVNQDKFPQEVGMTPYPPLAKFPATFGIIESQVKPLALPVTVRNLEAEVAARVLGTSVQDAVSLNSSGIRLGADQFPKIVKWMQVLETREREIHQGKYEVREHSVLDSVDQNNAEHLKVPVAQSGSNRASEVIGIPLKNTGFHIVEIESALLGESLFGKQAPMFVPSSALVTNLAAHLKIGKENSLVWVTSLDDGQPVAGASVGIHDCTGKKIWAGVSNANGLVFISSEVIKSARIQCTDLPNFSYGFFATATLNDDFTFVFSEWKKGLESYRYGITNYYIEDQRNDVIAHTIFDRPMFRAGETVSMKHLIRKLSTKGFSAVDEIDLPSKMMIVHFGSESKFSVPLKWDRKTMNSVKAEWTIPKDAKLGSYQVYLLKNNSEDIYSALPGGTFQVDQFEIPLTAATISLPKETLVRPTQVETDLGVSHLNGGAASNLPVIFTYYTTPKTSYQLNGFKDFLFGYKPVEIGTRSADANRVSDEDGSIKPKTQNLKLDAAGAVHLVMDGLNVDQLPMTLTTRMEYKSSGKTQTASRTKDLWPAHILVGIRTPQWNEGRKLQTFQVATATTEGKPVVGHNVDFETFRVRYLQHRSRKIGGIYPTEGVYVTEKINAKIDCPAATNNEGIAYCSIQSPVSGDILIQASVADSEGRKTYAVGSMDVDGPDNGYFRTEISDRIDLIPTKTNYEVGESATLQVRMPFSEATVLVTAEREGILSAHIEKITAQAPHVSVPITADFSPNVFISAFVVSGRVPGSEPTERDLVDLGKPSYRLGLTELSVNWKPRTLNVEVKTDRETYGPRSQQKTNTVTATVKVETADGRPLPAETEVALAVVDEGLLLLKPNLSWNVLERLMLNRPYQVQTATAQMQVIGKRHYGLKALPTGGGGGLGLRREMFDTLLFWSDRIVVNSEGTATVQFKTNDSLTKFKVVAVATGGLTRFGTGSTSFTTNQDLIMQPAVPALAREGDRYTPSATLRNTTAAPMDLQFNAIVTFTSTDGQKNSVAIPQKSVTLPAHQSMEVKLDEVTVPKGVSGAQYTMIVATSDGAQSDVVTAEQAIQPAIAVQTQMATIEKIQGVRSFKVQIPENSVDLKGGIGVTLSRSLTDSLNTVKEYMRDYPYNFLEAQLSRAVVMENVEQWNTVMAKLPSLLDTTTGLVKFYPGSRSGDVSLTAYILALAHESKNVIPNEIRTQMLRGLDSFINGRIRTGYETDNALRIRAMEALSRYKALDPSRVATVEWKATDRLKTSTIVDLINIAQRTANTGLNVATLEKVIRDSARLTVIGMQTTLTPNSASDYWMSSKDKAFASLLLVRMATPESIARWKQDFPRLISGFVKQQRRGTWDTTFANAWGALALRAFSRNFEKDPVTGKTEITLAAQNATTAWDGGQKSWSTFLSWPSTGLLDLNISHVGTGQPWAVVATRAAVKLLQPVYAGFTLDKTVTPIRQAQAGRWSVGDVAEVRLKVKGQAQISQVALLDPVPGGCKIRRTAGDNNAASTGGWQYPSYEEFANDSYRAFYESVGSSPFDVTYQIDFNTEGSFHVPSTRIEAIYNSEIFAERPNDDITIAPMPNQ